MATTHNKQSNSLTRARHADGTPFSPDAYRRPGMDVPTPAQLALLARADCENAAEEEAQRRRLRLIHRRR